MLLLESSDSSESKEEGGKLVRAGGWGRKPQMGDLVSFFVLGRQVVVAKLAGHLAQDTQ